ncbi:MAG TPA: hypothetical protein VMT63_14965 [Bacteroidales bacterium]|nr:hypothetical protein [Bacteroidales bacterium]
MERSEFIKNILRLMLLGLLAAIVLITGKRVTTSPGCSSCPGKGICKGEADCAVFKPGKNVEG